MSDTLEEGFTPAEKYYEILHFRSGINRKHFRFICFFWTGKVYEEDYY